MLDEIATLLGALAEPTARTEYERQIQELNVLGKPTGNSRQLTLRHLVGLYGLDPEVPMFRMFSTLWALDGEAKPLLALAMALARDPLLRMSEDFMLERPMGSVITRDDTAAFIAESCPGRFSEASLKSFAQNINGTWTQAGFLRGKVKKIRCRPKATPVNAAFCLFLGYLEGLSGQRLFSTRWTRILECSQDELVALTVAAGNRGLLVFMNAGGIMEVRFPGCLSAEEAQWVHEQDR